MRRDHGEEPSRLRPGRQYRLFDRLPASRRQISSRGGKLLETALQRHDEAQIFMGQLRAAIRLRLGVTTMLRLKAKNEAYIGGRFSYQRACCWEVYAARKTASSSKGFPTSWSATG